MTWQAVVITGLFVAAAVIMGTTGHDTLAATALGAAAGYVTGGLRKPSDVAQKLPGP
jgi:hypothetical protein